MSWKLLNSRTVIDDEWITVRSNDYLTRDGRSLNGYYLIERGDFVVIVAECRGKLVLVREHRVGTGRQYLGFPAGYIEAGEAPVAAAMREFQEETGFQALSGKLLAELDPQTKARFIAVAIAAFAFRAPPRPPPIVSASSSTALLSSTSSPASAASP